MSVVPRRVLATNLPPAPSLTRSDAATQARRVLLVHWSLGALLLGAAALNLAVAPSHFRESTLLGVATVGSACLQVGLAGAVVLFPTRDVLRATALISLALIVVWAVSRTAGLPVGHAGNAGAVTVADGVTVALQAIVATVAAILVAPRSKQVTAGVPAFIAAFGALAVATAAIASPAARDHVTGSRVVKAQATVTGSQADPRLDPATRAELQQQLDEARAFAMRYPTVSDATAAGYHLGGGFAPRRGATYITYGGLTSPGAFDPGRPEALVYGGISPTSPVIGLVYFAVSNTLPQGFVGLNAPWQRHSDVCVKFGPGGLQVPFPADADVTAAQCSGVQGNFYAIVGWTVHAWVVPSWQNPLGVFAADNPKVRCADGTYHADQAGYCQGT
jgi:hypothetical protein